MSLRELLTRANDFTSVLVYKNNEEFAEFNVVEDVPANNEFDDKVSPLWDYEFGKDFDFIIDGMLLTIYI